MRTATRFYMYDLGPFYYASGLLTSAQQIGGWATSLGPETFMRSAHYLIDRGADINEPNNRGG